MNETAHFFEAETSISVSKMLRERLLTMRTTSINTLQVLRSDILSGKHVTVSRWGNCIEVLDSICEILRSARGTYPRLFSFDMPAVEQLHDEVLFALKSKYGFFVQLFETDEYVTWYFCTITHYIVEIHQKTGCMKSYPLHKLPMNVHIESRNILSSIAVLNGLQKAIESGFTALSRRAMRDFVMIN
jgi:hypothetical protein